MNKAQKELIEKAIKYNGEPITSLYIISKDRLYDGFWGKNGYNEIVVIAYSRATDQYFKWDSYPRDVINILKEMQFSIDIPNKLNCVRLFFHKPITLKTDQLSSFIID